MGLPARSHRLHSPGGSELSHGDRAGARRARRWPIPAALADRASAIIAQNPDIAGSFSVMGFAWPAAPPTPGMMFIFHHALRSAARPKATPPRDIVADLFAQADEPDVPRPIGGLVAIFQPPAVQGVGSYGASSSCSRIRARTTLSDLDPRGAPDCGRKPGAQGYDRAAYHLLGQRPAVLVTIDREKSQGDERSALADHRHAGRLHGIGVHQRLRLQQPHLPRLRAGRSALSHDGQGICNNYYVRSDSGPDGPLDNLVTVAESAGPPVITHYNLFRAVRDRRLAGAGLQLRTGNRRHGRAGQKSS